MTETFENSLELQGPRLAKVLVTLATLCVFLAFGSAIWWCIAHAEATRAVATFHRLESSPETLVYPSEKLEKSLLTLPLPSAAKVKTELTSAIQKNNLTLVALEDEEAPQQSILTSYSHAPLRLFKIRVTGSFPSVLQLLQKNVEAQPLRWLTLLQIDTADGQSVYSAEILAAVQ